MEYRHDPPTGRHCLTAPHSEMAMGVTITRDAGYVWHVGKWPLRIRNPSTVLRAASYWHDAAYEDLAWDYWSLQVADAGFVEVYVRRGGNPILAASMWIALRGWSIWTAMMRVKPEKWRTP